MAKFCTKALFDPENYCPICGARMSQHAARCRKEVLLAIDAANTRALTEEYRPPDYREHNIDYRLDIGFMLLSDDDVADDEAAMTEESYYARQGYTISWRSRRTSPLRGPLGSELEQ